MSEVTPLLSPEELAVAEAAGQAAIAAALAGVPLTPVVPAPPPDLKPTER